MSTDVPTPASLSCMIGDDIFATPNLTSHVLRVGRDPLAVGGYSTVWRGLWQPSEDSLEHKVVIKILRISSTARDQLMRTRLAKRLYREMKVWTNLSHPNIVALLGHTTDPGAPALISPFYKNGCVLEYLEKCASADRYHICADIATGLSYLHSHDPPIIHGDIKGANILIDGKGNAALCDFGLSMVMDGGATGYTSSEFAGTLRYLAPELLEEGSVRTFETDVYALGCTCIQILTSEQPYHGLRAGAQIMRAIIAGHPPFQMRENQASLCIDFLTLQGTWDPLPSLRPAVQELAVSMKARPSQDAHTIQPDPKSRRNALEVNEKNYCAKDTARLSPDVATILPTSMLLDISSANLRGPEESRWERALDDPVATVAAVAAMTSSEPLYDVPDSWLTWQPNPFLVPSPWVSPETTRDLSSVRNNPAAPPFGGDLGVVEQVQLGLRRALRQNSPIPYESSLDFRPDIPDRIFNMEI